MLASIVIPTFNRAALIGDCLDALGRQQSAPLPFEIVVVDDGSTDGTELEVRKRQAKLGVTVRYFRQMNAGPGVARNNGVKVSSGELIVFLGDDIIVYPDY